MVILMSPYMSPTQLAVLPDPEIGNQEALGIKTSITHSLSRVVHTTRYTPASRTLKIDFKSLPLFLCDQVRDVVSQPENDLRYIDNRGAVWRVKLLSQPVQLQNSNAELYDLTLEFDGVKQ
jgi:hypothetical protein